MSGIYISVTLLFLWLCIAGITLLTSRFIPVYPVARASGLVALVLVLFFVEHFIGLGSLNWVLPLGLLGSGWVLWKNRGRVSPIDWPLVKHFWRPAVPNQVSQDALIKGYLPANRFWTSELIFVLAFLYGFIWRLVFPSISPSSEQITDLFFISNYFPGHTLPPLDNWSPPHSFDYYYAFQHYAAALMGRVFNLNIGLCYSLSYALITALPISLAWFITGYFVQKKAKRCLLVATLVIGGSGLSPVLQLAYDSPARPSADSAVAAQVHRAAQEAHAREKIIASARFIGDARDTNLHSTAKLTAVGGYLFPETSPPESLGEQMVLPSENFGYQYFVGDYHPSLGGFFILLLALALMVCIEYGIAGRLAQALLAASVPVLMVTNTWVFPLLVLTISGWLVFRWHYRQPIEWRWLLAGGMAATFLIYPFLTGFATRNLQASVAWVASGEHTPPARFLALHWPVLVLLALGFFEPRFRKLSLAFSTVWLGLLLLSELIYIDDPTGGKYQRTNTTMKWWGWVHVGVLVTLGSLCLGSSSKTIRWSTVVVLLLVNVQIIELGRYWIYSGKHYVGRLEGHYWYTRDPAKRQAFEFLASAPNGIVLENIRADAYSNTSIYGLFNHKPVLLGWPSHLNTWHGQVPRVWQLRDEIQAFYRGENDQALQWLLGHNVRYVVFTRGEGMRHFEAINQQIGSHFLWQEFSYSQANKTGIWVRIDSTPPR